MSAASLPTTHAGPSSQVLPRTTSSHEDRPCLSCGRSWPWAHFSSLVGSQLSSVCSRCSDAKGEERRWKTVHRQMTKSILHARRELAKHRAQLGGPNISQTPAAVSQAIPNRQTSYSSHLPSSSVPHVQASNPPHAAQHPTVMSRQMSGTASSARPPMLGAQAVLSDQQLDIAARNMPTVLRMPEPERTIIWMQLNFRPAPPDHHVQQIDIFKAYQMQFSTLPSSEYPPPYDGPRLIKLPLSIWPGTKLSGKPLYSMSGLAVKPGGIASANGVLTYRVALVKRGVSSGNSVIPTLQPMGVQDTIGQYQGFTQSASTSFVSPPVVSLPQSHLSTHLPNNIPLPMPSCSPVLISKPLQKAQPATTSGTRQPFPLDMSLANISSTTTVHHTKQEKRSRSGEKSKDTDGVVMIDDDESAEGDEDDWKNLRPTKRSKGEDERDLSKAKIVIGGMTIQPRSSLSIQAKKEAQVASSQFGDNSREGGQDGSRNTAAQYSVGEAREENSAGVDGGMNVGEEIDELAESEDEVGGLLGNV
ncbi:hypothetical protein IAR55_004211 [Kwoniella newhampshirensis]|uniref:GATA-type domain-containing protein n=1 Tax=Kwoniella newhampshirensis TaxID=1651941 RepID=A0AAW0YY86_9TREE